MIEGQRPQRYRLRDDGGGVGTTIRQADPVLVSAMRREEAIQRLRASSDRLKEAGVHALFLFGSTARDEADPDSDVDVFVDPDYERFGFVELLRVEALLANSLGRAVDLTTRDGLHPLLRPAIERDAIRVL